MQEDFNDYKLKVKTIKKLRNWIKKIFFETFLTLWNVTFGMDYDLLWIIWMFWLVLFYFVDNNLKRIFFRNIVNEHTF